MLHVYILHALVPCLPFSRCECFVLIQHNIEDILVISCLLFSGTYTLSTFFTVRFFYYDTAYGGTSHCFMSTFFTNLYLVYLFHGEKVSCRCCIRWYFPLLHVHFFSRTGTWSTFFTMRMFRSDTAYIRTSRCFMPLFSRTSTWSTFFTVRIFCYDTAYAGTSHCFMFTF